jgi:serine/threonine protein kinase
VQANQPLPEGFQLDDYRILRVLAAGGQSIVYLAQDRNGAAVALKEYLPARLALRTGSNPALAVPAEKLATFRAGMKCFFEEGKSLAGLRHPNVVRVLNFFRANGTAYMAMRYQRGRTLQDHIGDRGRALTELWICNTFLSLLDGLREVHSTKLLHLDIKPGNIYIRDDGAPLLIDFGAARQALSAGGGKLSSMHTPGFASPEHCGTRGRLGPWSDIYSVGASMYACLAAAPPPAADERMAMDRVLAARRGWSGKYSAELLDTIDWCLRMDPIERPQSVFALQKALTGEKAPGYRGEQLAPNGFKQAILRLAAG